MKTTVEERIAEIDRDLDSLSSLPARLTAEGCTGMQYVKRLIAAGNYKVRLVREREVLLEPKPEQPAPAPVSIPASPKKPRKPEPPITSPTGRCVTERKPANPRKVKKLRDKIAFLNTLEHDSKERLAGPALQERISRIESSRLEVERELMDIGARTFEPKESEQGVFGQYELLHILCRCIGMSEVPVPRNPMFNDLVRDMFRTAEGMRLMFALGAFTTPHRRGDFKNESIDSKSVYFGRRFRVFIPETKTIRTDAIHQVRYDALNKRGEGVGVVTRNIPIQNAYKYETGETMPGTCWRGIKVMACWRWDGEMWHPHIVCRNVSAIKRLECEDMLHNLNLELKPYVVGYDKKTVAKWSGGKHGVIVCTPDGEQVEQRSGTVYEERWEMVKIAIDNVPHMPTLKGMLPDNRRDVVVGEFEPEPMKPEPAVSLEVAQMFKGKGVLGKQDNAALVHHQNHKRIKAHKKASRMNVGAELDRVLGKPSKVDMEAFNKAVAMKSRR